MQFPRNQKIATAMTLILILTVTASIALPAVRAHDPPWDIPSWCYIMISPDSVGINQQVLIVFWTNVYPTTAQGAYGDRWTFYVDITKPDGTKETLGPITSDPIGGGYASYTPTQVGTYSIVARFPGHKYTGQPAPPTGIVNAAYVNDTIRASTSDPVTLVVTETPRASYAETPLPDGYWTRPISTLNRDWWQVTGNWLAGAAQQWPLGGAGGTTTNYAYGPGPESAHVLWTRSIWEGGIEDYRFGAYGYQTYHYEGLYFSPPIILNGKFYYTKPYNPEFGWYCVDLYTGDTLYFRNTTGPISGYNAAHTGFDPHGELAVGRLAFGQVLKMDLPNQHGGFPYLWVTSTGVTNKWDMYDGFSGDYICSIANVSATGTNVYGKDGSILYYSLQNYGTTANPKYYLRVWNTTHAIWWKDYSKIAANTYWMWRPYLNYTFDGNNGWSLNVSTPLTHSTTIRAIRQDEYIIGGATGSNNEQGITQGHFWCLSLKPGQVGTLMWNITFTPPSSAGNTTVSLTGVYPEYGVFLFEDRNRLLRWGYSLDTGQLLWTGTKEPDGNYYGMSEYIYDGKILACGYGGVLQAYDIKTGKILWNYTAKTEGFESPYGTYPMNVGVIADGKAYIGTGEHSPTQPLYRGNVLQCINVSNGALLWNFPVYGVSQPSGNAGSNFAIADGKLLALNAYDNQIYCFGKGPSATTVTASPKVSVHGNSVMIEGTVTDQTPSGRHNTNGGVDFVLKGTPAISDEDMSAWMQYLFQQRPCPGNAKGVDVTLDALDPNGNFVHIGTACSDITGTFALAFTPEVPGPYQIIATFAGSKSYGSSFAQTYIQVDEAPPASPPPEYPQPIDPTMTIVYATIAIIIAVVVSVAVATMMLKKR
ncbi:MAG: hypothetical protein NWE94_07715 [Candidatus Bathyarchaeota archaeon]|nr:hypothetical protein [Candidatus Bathyarchaeota archaeon]